MYYNAAGKGDEDLNAEAMQTEEKQTPPKTAKKPSRRKITDIAPACGGKTEKQNAQEEESITDFLKSRRGDVKKIISVGLSILSSEEKMEKATPAQIVSMIEALVGLFFSPEEELHGQLLLHSELIEAIKERNEN